MRATLDYAEIQISGRQVAKLRKGRLSQYHFASVRRVSPALDADPTWRGRRYQVRRLAA